MEHKFHTKMSSSNGGTFKKNLQEFPSIITVFTDQQNFVFVLLGL